MWPALPLRLGPWRGSCGISISGRTPNQSPVPLPTPPTAGRSEPPSAGLRPQVSHEPGHGCTLAPALLCDIGQGSFPLWALASQPYMEELRQRGGEFQIRVSQDTQRVLTHSPPQHPCQTPVLEPCSQTQTEAPYKKVPGLTRLPLGTAPVPLQPCPAGGAPQTGCPDCAGPKPQGPQPRGPCVEPAGPRKHPFPPREGKGLSHTHIHTPTKAAGCMGCGRAYWVGILALSLPSV